MGVPMRNMFTTVAAISAAMLLAGQSNASEVTFGDPASATYTGDCTPGCTPTIQTVYSRDAFPGTVQIDSLSLWLQGYGDLAPLTITLSTTNKSWDGLSTTFAENAGPDAALFFSGVAPVVDGVLKTTFVGTPFVYDPSLGNLLVEIKSDSSYILNSAYTSWASSVQAERMFTFTPGKLTADYDEPSGYVFVTTFGVSDVVGGVPEPTTWALMIGGFGLIGGTMRRRKLATA